MAHAVRRSPPTAGVLSSRLGPSMWVSWWTKRDLGSFSRGFSRFPLPQSSFHHFSTLISSISFHFISPCDDASDVVGRHPCYSRTYNIGASSHLIPRPDLVLDTSWGYLFYIYFLVWKVVTYSFPTNFNTIIKTNKHTIAETRLWDLKGSSCCMFL